jgi:hypothetical protein
MKLFYKNLKLFILQRANALCVFQYSYGIYNGIKKVLISIVLVLIVHSSFSQTGPGGVGNDLGSSDLKLWYRTDNGISVTGTLVDSWQNSAGIAVLDISETGAQRPTLVSNAVNGFSEVSYSGSTRLRTGTTLTTSNFITNQASSFTVSRADNTSQTSCVYTTDPLVGSTRFSNHIPWANTIYFDIGTCCSNDARMQVGGLTGLTSYSIWTYDASPALGKQLYRNGALLQNRANTTTYSSHATHRFNIGGNTSGTNGFVGDVAEIIIFNVRVNSAQRIIIDNYLAAKFGLALAVNDLFVQDNPANGNFDFNVAGIGRVDASNLHNDAQGTGIVRILNPSGLGNNEFLIWGHNNELDQATNISDVPATVEARFERVWRVNEVNAAGAAVNVGAVDIRFDLTGLGTIAASDLRLLVDTDNDGLFNDETPISGATNVGGDVYEFAGVTAIANNLRFTIGTINSSSTPLPIELLYFNAIVTDQKMVRLDWQTASESSNDFFTIERSTNGMNWEFLKSIKGAGNSSALLTYSATDSLPYSGISYYRLKQTDFDGQFSYSQMREVNMNAWSQSTVQIYPNPSDDQIIVEGSADELSQISIYNALGKEVTTMMIITNISAEKVQIGLSKLNSGMYFLKTKSAINKVFKQ